MDLTVYFVRHAESEANKHLHDDPQNPKLDTLINNHGNPSITELGKKQSDITADALHKYINGKCAIVWSSKFKRTIETAAPFLKSHSEFLNEYIQQNCLQEYTKQTKKLSKEDTIQGIVHDRVWKDFIKRVEATVEKLESLGQGIVVIFGHSLFLSAMATYIGSGKLVLPNKDKLVFRFPNCSITKFRYVNKDWTIPYTASIGHLSEGVTTGVE